MDSDSLHNHRVRGHWLRAISTACVVLGACGDNRPPPDPVPLESLGDALIASLCDWSYRCRHVPEREECERLVDPKSYDIRRAIDAVTAGRLGYDPQKGGECVSAQRDGACLAATFKSTPCRNMFLGLRTEGQTCTSSFECSGESQCEEPVCEGQCCVGVCGPAGPATVSAPALAKPGQACVTHQDCVPTAHCGFDRRCARLPDKVGEDCVFGCAWGDLYCDIDTLTCLAWGSDGEACDGTGETGPACDPAWSYCDGVCKRRPGPGDACVHPDARCIVSSFCDGSLCVARGSSGASCEDSTQCEVVCDGQNCVDYLTCDA